MFPEFKCDYITDTLGLLGMRILIGTLIATVSLPSALITILIVDDRIGIISILYSTSIETLYMLQLSAFIIGFFWSPFIMSMCNYVFDENGISHSCTLGW